MRERQIPGYVSADVRSHIDGSDYTAHLNSTLPHPDDDSFAFIELDGDTAGSRRVCKVFGKVVEREEVAAILDGE